MVPLTRRHKLTVAAIFAPSGVAAAFGDGIPLAIALWTVAVLMAESGIRGDHPPG
jgi:hypothetical protein